jgi:DNA polymerase III gamma/tau subunit
MRQTDLLSRLLDAGMTFTGLSRARAEEVVRDLLRAGAMQAENTQSNVDALVDELIERSRRNGERFIQTVRAELDEQAARLDPPTRDDIEKIVHRFADVAMSLLRQVTERGGDATQTHGAGTRDALRPAPQASIGATPAGVKATEPATELPAPPAGAVTPGTADWAGTYTTATPSGRMGDTMTGAAKAPARKAATRKATGRKAVAKRPAKKTATRKSAAKKTTARKTAAKKTARKSAAKKTARKTAAKKTTARKSAAKKTARKSAAKKTTARKSAAKKTTARKSAAKKTARKTAAKKTTARKTAAKRSTAKKSAAKKGPARKTAARKTAAKRAASR